jgi:hypothetical protein
MGARQTFRTWLYADAPAAPSTEDKAASSAASPVASQFGDTTARIGTYNLERIPESTFDKMCRHFQVRFGVAIRELLLTAPEWSVRGADPRIDAYVAAVLESVRVKLVRACVRTGAMRGAATFEPLYEHAVTSVEYPGENGEPVTEDVEGYRLRKLKTIARSNIRSILIDGVENLAGVEVNVPSGAKLLVERGECFVFSHNADDAGSYWGAGDLISAYDPWYRQQVIWDQAVRYTERFATPPTVAYHPPGQASDGSENSEHARRVVDGFMGANATATLPLGSDGEGKLYKTWDVEFKAVTTSASADFIAMLEYHDRAILRGVLVPDTVATQQQSTGSLALSNTHMDVLTLIEDGLLDEILDAVNAQLVPNIVRYTFGADAPVPRVESVGLTNERVAKLQAVFDKALEKGYVTNLDVDALADTLGVPVAEQTEAPTEPVEGEPLDASTRAAMVAMREAAQDVRMKLAAGGEA